MKNKLFYILPLITVLFVACNNSNSKAQILEKTGNFNYLNSIFIDVMMPDSTVGKFILDSGSPITVLDSSFYRDDFGLQIIDSILVGGTSSSGRILMPLYDYTDMYVLNNKIESDVIVVTNLKKLIPIEDGIIGLLFFYNNIVEIDYENEMINLISDSSKIDKSYTKIELFEINYKLYIKLELAINSTTIDGLFLIDTGSEHAIKLDKYYVDSLDLYNSVEKKIEKTTKNGGVNGTTYKFNIKAKQAKIADFTIDNVLLSCTNPPKNKKSKKHKVRLGTVGNVFLSRFSIVFDMKNSAFYLKPNSLYSSDFEHCRSGIRLGKETKKGFLINSVHYNYSVQSFNVLEGDILFDIDNKSVLELGYLKSKAILQEKGKHQLKLYRNNEIIDVEIDIIDIMNLL